MYVSRRVSSVIVCAATLLWSAPAVAQYSVTSPVVGEEYHVEAAIAWWNPDPKLVVSSESLGIPGDDVDLVADLGVEKKRLRELRFVLRPATKHKFRINYLPIKYSAEALLQREFVFNGQRYRIGLPVNTEADLTTWRFGYEYDFIYRSRGYLGVLVDLKYTNVDVVLDSPNVCVERIFLKVDSVTAKLNLNAQVANLVRVNAGADVLIGNVDLTILDVRARALLLVDLDDVVHIVDQTLTFVDNNPQIIEQLGSTLQNTVGTVGTVVGGTLRGLVLGVTRLANGNTLQRVVNEATGEILERTLSTAGSQIAQRVVGSVLRLPTIRETTNAAGQAVRQVRDTAGSLLEYTLDRATNRVLGVRLLQAATGR